MDHLLCFLFLPVLLSFHDIIHFRTAPKSAGTDDSGYEDAMTEELYIKNVSALRESLEQQARQNQRNVTNEYSAVCLSFTLSLDASLSLSLSLSPFYQ